MAVAIFADIAEFGRELICEMRFDDALNGVKAYNGSTNQFTFGLDLVVKI